MIDLVDSKAWFRADIGRLLDALKAAAESGHLERDEFMRGYISALGSIALAVGLPTDVWETEWIQQQLSSR